MYKVFDIPELVGKIISYLPVKSQCTVSRVNRTWRLEARRQFYINRKKIIDELLRKGLLNLGPSGRRRRLVNPELTLSKAIDFIKTLNLNVVDELKAINSYYSLEIFNLGKEYKEETKKFTLPLLSTSKSFGLRTNISDISHLIIQIEYYLDTIYGRKMTKKAITLSLRKFNFNYGAGANDIERKAINFSSMEYKRLIELHKSKVSLNYA